MKNARVILFAATIMLLAGAMFPGSLSADAVSAVIRECIGDVEVKAAEGEWVPAQPGMTLDSASLISTGFKSSAVLVIGNSSVLVRPLTRLSLDELLALGKNEQIGINLRVGRVHADVLPPDGGVIDFKVISPMVTASVRGTQFEFNAVNLMVQSGTVAFTGRDRATVYATAGKFASLDRQGRSVLPVTVEERQLAQTEVGAAEVSPPTIHPASPVVAGPDGVMSVPGTIGGPGGGISNATTTGGAEVTTGW
jgi:hypothetical protein